MASKSQVSDIARLYAAMSYDEISDVFPAAKHWLIGQDPLKCFYHGKLDLISESGKYKTLAVKDPCTDDYLASLVVPSVEDVKNVLQSSTHGQKSWNSLDQHTRGKFISSLARKLEEQKDKLAEVEALTSGASLSVTKLEISRVAKYFHYYAAWAHTVKKKIGDTDNGILVLCLSKSAPILALAAAVAPALSAGWAIVLNPPSEAPLTSFLFAELCSVAGLPPGVVNVIPGSLDLTKEIKGPHVGKIVAWGSKSNLKSIWSDISDISCPVVPFSYGKSIGIIFDSSDQSSAIEILFKNMSFSYQQMPWSVKTILVEESAYPTFVSMLKKKLSGCKTGNARNHGIDIGLPNKCDSNASSFLNIALDHFRQRGIEVFQIPVDDTLFFPPTLIIGSDAETNSIVKDHDVLPFVSVLPFRNSKEAVEFANKSQFGVAASVWTSCLSLAMYMAANLEVGTVWINDHGVLDPSVPFSSWKHGFGCIGSVKGLQQFLSLGKEEKSTLLDSKSSGDIAQSQIQKEYFAHYGGATRPTVNDACFSVLSSSGGHFLIHECDRGDVKKAVDAARSAQQKWWKLGSNGRAALLLNAADKFQEISQDFLKFFQKAAPGNEKELDCVVNNLYLWASRCNNMMSFQNYYPYPNCVVQSFHEPFGVIGILMEDSSDLQTFAIAVLSAIAFGNSVVVVPNYRNPVLALEFCAYLANTKIPPGLVNVIPGLKDILYSEVVFHKDVRAAWYSGSDIASKNVLNNMASKVSKFLWKFPDNTDTFDVSEFEYAASFPKAVWLPSENSSC